MKTFNYTNSQNINFLNIFWKIIDEKQHCFWFWQKNQFFLFVGQTKKSVCFFLFSKSNIFQKMFKFLILLFFFIVVFLVSFFLSFLDIFFVDDWRPYDAAKNPSAIERINDDRNAKTKKFILNSFIALFLYKNSFKKILIFQKKKWN